MNYLNELKVVIGKLRRWQAAAMATGHDRDAKLLGQAVRTLAVLRNQWEEAEKTDEPRQVTD